MTPLWVLNHFAVYNGCNKCFLFQYYKKWSRQFYPFGSGAHLTMMYGTLVIYLQRLEGKCSI